MLDEKLIIGYRRDFSFINVNDILFFERANDKTLIHTATEEYQIYLSLKELEKVSKINECNFKRVHRSFLINFNHIKHLRSLDSRLYEIIYNEDKTAIGRKKKVKEKIYKEGGVLKVANKLYV